MLQAERGEHVVEAGDHEDPVGGQEVPRPSAGSRPTISSASKGEGNEYEYVEGGDDDMMMTMMTMMILTTGHTRPDGAVPPSVRSRHEAAWQLSRPRLTADEPFRKVFFSKHLKPKPKSNIVSDLLNQSLTIYLTTELD